jgi:hypothetical protein
LKVEVSPYASVSVAIIAAERKIDAAAEAARSKLMTLGSGQSLEYGAVYAEALDFNEDPTGEYPLLQATVAAGYATNLEQAAGDVIIAQAALLDGLAEIRKTRLDGKRRVRLCATQTEVTRVRDETLAKFSAP